MNREPLELHESQNGVRPSSSAAMFANTVASKLQNASRQRELLWAGTATLRIFISRGSCGSRFNLFFAVSLLMVLMASEFGAVASITANSFKPGIVAYEQNDFPLAAKLFAESTAAAQRPGALQNLGNAEWQNARTAEAIIAWERALLLIPRSSDVENNLKFARESAQLESPELTWCEIVASWLPATVWAWLACGSLWFAVGAMIVPGVLRWRRSATQQAVVALSLGVLLLTLPANYGVWTRSQIGFVLKRETPLRLTPTAEAEAASKLTAGEPGRVLRERGKYLFIRTRRTVGWIERTGFVLVTPTKPR